MGEGKDREQEAECACQEEVCHQHWTLDAGRQEGAFGPEAQGFRRRQEGLATLYQGEGVLQRKVRSSCEVSGAWTQRSASSRCGAFYACRAQALPQCLALPLTKGQSTESPIPLYTQ